MNIGILCKKNNQKYNSLMDILFSHFKNVNFIALYWVFDISENFPKYSISSTYKIK